MTKKKNRQKELTSKVLCSLLAAGVLTVALPLSGFAEMQKIEYQTVDNKIHSGWGDLKLTDLLITGSTFQNNKNEGDEGANGGAFSTYGSNGQLKVTINGSTFAGNQAVTTSDNKNIGDAALGGAIMIKGTDLTMTDTEFRSNIVKTITGNAFAGGGAVYLDATVNNNGSFPAEAKIFATKDLIYSGNNVEGADDTWYANTYGALAQSGGGFMFLDRNASAEFSVADGATLTIGAVGATGDMDSIASAIPEKVDDKNKYAAITKKDAGTLTINSSLNKYYGTLAVEAGTMNVNQDWTVKNAVTVNGGTLNMVNVTLEKIQDKIIAVDTNGQSQEYAIKSPAVGALAVNGGNVNALSIDATRGSVTMKSGALKVYGSYTGDLLATEGESKILAKSFTGRILAKEGGALYIDLGTGTLTGNGTGDKEQDFSRGIRAIVDQKEDSKASAIDIKAGNVVVSSEQLSAIQAAIPWVRDGETINSNLMPKITITANNVSARSEKEAAVTGQDGNVIIKAADRVTLTTGENSTESVIYARNHSSDQNMGIVSIEAKNIDIFAGKDDGYAVNGNTRGKVNIKASEAVNIKGSIASYNKEMQSDKSGIMINVAGARVNASGTEINAADDSSVTITGGAGSSLAYTDIIAAANKEELSSNSGGTINIDFAEGGNVEGKVTAQNGGVINLGGKITFDSEKTNFITMNDGVINLSSGEMDGVLNIAKDSSVSLSGATFTADNLANSITGGGKLVLTGNGTLATTAGQVFSVGDATTKSEADLNGNEVLESATAKVNFSSGTLKLTDAEYSLGYVASAGNALKAENSKTNILMSGKLVEDGKIQEAITIDQATSVGDDILLDDVVVKDDKKNLLIGTTLDNNEAVTVDEVTINKDSKTVANGFSAAKLELGEDSTGVVLTNNQELNLGGSQGGELVTVAKGDENTTVDLVIGTTETVGNASDMTGTLNIGKFTAPETDNRLIGSITVNDGSAVNVVNGNLNVTDCVTLAGGSVAVGNGVLTADITAAADKVSTVTGTAVVNNLTLNAATGNEANAVLNLGSETKAAHVTVTNLELNGGTLFLDPVWNGGEIYAGTEVAIADTEVDGKLVVGENSTLSLGTEDTSLAEAAFAKTGLTWGDDVLSAVYLADAITLAEYDSQRVVGGLYVAADATSESGDAGTVTFGSKSLLMVDGAKIIGTAAISGVTAASVADGSVLYIDGAQKGQTYKILTGLQDGDNTFWENDKIIADNKLLAFTGDNETSSDSFDVTASLQTVNKVFGNKVVIGNVVDATLAGNDESAAAKFFNNAVSSTVNATEADTVNALNSVANMGELAGVSHGTYSMSNIMTDAVGDHLSLAGGEHQDTDIWAHYIHNKEDVRNMDMGGMQGSYDLKYNGIVVGGDFYNQGKTTAGVALSYAKGDVNSVGNTVSTKNDAEYYGISLYGRINNGDSAVLGDISYLHGKNDITQNNSDTEITAAPKSDAFSIGVKAEKVYALGDGKLVPFAGLRYLHLGVGDYSNSLGMHYNADDQNMWLLPVGVTYSYETKAGDWTIRPLVEAGYVWTAGDRGTDQTVSLNGASDGFGYNVADSGSFVGRFALEAEKANVTFGLGYEYQKGDSVKANRLMANVSFSF